MTTTNLNIRVDREIKDKSENIFAELGLNMTTAVNMFLRASIRENGIPFDLRLDTPDSTTAAAIEEGRRMASDPDAKGYHSIDELRTALEV